MEFSFLFLFPSLCHCVLPKAVGCSMGRVYSWVLFEGGQAQVRGPLSGYLLIPGAKGNIGHVTGKFHGWIQRLALVVYPFLGNPFYTSLAGLGVIPDIPRAAFKVRPGLFSVQAWHLGCCFEDRSLHINLVFPCVVSLVAET